MLSLEILEKIGKKLSFLDLNRFAEATDLPVGLDKRIITTKEGFLACPICFHQEIDDIIKDVFDFDSDSPEYKGMR